MALQTITIDLGKGVVIQAPFKKHWSVGEWNRMTAHIGRFIRSAEHSTITK